MKKAKVVLSALVVLTVVGGALAFKAQTFGGNLQCGPAVGNCPNKTYTTTISGGQNLYCTPIGGNQNLCTLQQVKFDI